jgi:hypothetical protein
MPVTLACTKTIIELLKDISTLLAAVGALAYFGYKIFAGWLLLNLNVIIGPKRQSVEGEDDHLVVERSLAKGKVDASRFISGWIQVTPIDPSGPSLDPKVVSAGHRLPYAFGGKPDWGGTDPRNPYLTLSTEETLSLAEHFRIKPKVVYRIDVIIQGDRFRDRLIPSLSQWRASAIVLPVEAWSE